MHYLGVVRPVGGQCLKYALRLGDQRREVTEERRVRRGANHLPWLGLGSRLGLGCGANHLAARQAWSNTVKRVQANAPPPTAANTTTAHPPVHSPQGRITCATSFSYPYPYPLPLPLPLPHLRDELLLAVAECGQEGLAPQEVDLNLEVVRQLRQG